MPGMESPLAMPAITWLGVMEALAGSTEVFLSANKSDRENLYLTDSLSIEGIEKIKH